MTTSSYENKTLAELYQMARELEMTGYSKLRKKDLIFEIEKCLAKTSSDKGTLSAEGVLDIINDGFGFLRPNHYLPSNDDIYVSQSQIRRFDLRTGDKVKGIIRSPIKQEKYFALMQVEEVNGLSPETAKNRLHFHGLTPIYPNEQLVLENCKNISDYKNISGRFIDLIAPIGKGQRGLIVAPPKAGKTMLLCDIANAISQNNSDAELIMLLIDERPEEVTDIERSVKAEVVSSTFDELPENHLQLVDMVLERAMRLVEHKKDVVILMDSITRYARACNLVVPPSGRTLSGGLDPISLYRPKRFLGAARNIEEGGSLTILATVLVDTGSRMDEVIFEEFKGTGNLELVLDRNLAERRIFPAIDIRKSGTRRDDLILSKECLDISCSFRDLVGNMSNYESMDSLREIIFKTKSNKEAYEVLSTIKYKKNK